MSNLLAFPVFDPSTPKVSILSIGKGVLESAIELVIEAKQQTAKFQPQASAKAGFMLTNYGGPDRATECTLSNATGVRLELFKADSEGLLPEYTPPLILEPGEVASFLVGKDAGFKLKYNIQTFQGPIAQGRFGEAGWVSGDPDKTVTIQGQGQTRKTIKAVIQVDQITQYPTEITFDVSRKNGSEVNRPWQISVTQSITGYSLSGKAAVLGSGTSILLGGLGDLGFAGGESWTIELWVRVESILPGGANDSDQTVFGSDNETIGGNLSCIFRNGGKLHLDFFATGAVDDPDPINIGEWTHFALQFEQGPFLAPEPANVQGDLRMFRNGVLVAANRSQPLTGNAPLRLGQYLGGRPLRGSLAQVRLWNVAVPASEIMARLYTSGPSTAPGLREVLDFSDPNDPPIKGIVLVPFEVKP